MALVIVALALYLAVPIIIAAVLRGQSPLTTAATSGIQMALTAAGLASMAGTRLAARGAAAPGKTAPTKQDEAEGDVGHESTGMAPQPSTTPTSFGPAQAMKRRGGTTTEETEESSAERQSRILSGYEFASQTTRTTKIQRPVSETVAALDQAG